MKSKQYAKLYCYRWKIEKFHRTIKQFLGFGKCFSTKSEVYMNHIKAAGLAYCKPQKLIKKFKLNYVYLIKPANFPGIVYTDYYEKTA